MAETSTKPYMIRALYEWCCDNGYTPYLAVAVDRRTRVPHQHVKSGEIVLNVSPLATNRLQLGNELIEFQARFSGVAQDISIPIGNVSAIYARETGHGMAFEVERPAPVDGEVSDGSDAADGGAERGDTPAAHDAAAADTDAPVADRGGLSAVPDADPARRPAPVTTLPGRGRAGAGAGADTADNTGAETAAGAEVIAFAPAPGDRRRKGSSSPRSVRKSAPGAEAGGGADSSAKSGDGAGDGAGAEGQDVRQGGVRQGQEASDGAGTGAAEPSGSGETSGDDEPPSGGGKAGRARLTRIK